MSKNKPKQDPPAPKAPAANPPSAAEPVVVESTPTPPNPALQAMATASETPAAGDDQVGDQAAPEESPEAQVFKQEFTPPAVELFPYQVKQGPILHDNQLFNAGMTVRLTRAQARRLSIHLALDI